MSQGQYRNNYMKKSRDAFALAPPPRADASRIFFMYLVVAC